jgi:hypothetical protein
MVIVLFLIVAILAALIAWLSLVINIELGYLRFFTLLPPIKRYYMAIDAINDLEGVKNWTIIKQDKNSILNQSTINPSNRGFKELTKIIKLDRRIDKTISQLRITIFADITSIPFKYTKALLITRDDVESTVMLEHDDLDRTRIILMEMVEKYVRRYIVNASGVLILIWLLLQAVLLFIVN